MAVPKRKTSKARRDQRRATHKLEAPRVNTCPQCGSPKRAHRVCPTCGTYKGREVEPLRLDGAGDDLGRGAVSAHRVDRDAGHGSRR